MNRSTNSTAYDVIVLCIPIKFDNNWIKNKFSEGQKLKNNKENRAKRNECYQSIGCY